MVVSKYEVTRHYGGPEEGGWWYDRHHYVETITVPCSPDEAQIVAKALNEHYKEQKLQPSGNYQGRYSVANHTDVYAIVENEPRDRDDTDEPRPRYE